MLISVELGRRYFTSVAFQITSVICSILTRVLFTDAHTTVVC